VSLSIETRPADARTMLVILKGEVDYATAQDVRMTISAALGGGGVERIVADVAGVTFLDSTGVGTLVVARRICADCRVAFSIRNPNPFVAKLLTVVGVAEALGVMPVPGIRPRRPLDDAAAQPA
jgi:anti-sigma B factor antagonist